MFDAQKMSVSNDGKQLLFAAEASELGLAPGEVLRNVVCLNCPRSGQHRSFEYVDSTKNSDGDVLMFNYKEMSGPNRSDLPILITVFND